MLLCSALPDAFGKGTCHMKSKGKSDWKIPIGWIVFSIIPVGVGIARVTGLMDGVDIPKDSAVLFGLPLSLFLHIVGACVFCVLGAFQFAPGFRQKNRKWHKIAGRILVPAGLTGAFGSVWYAMFHAQLEDSSIVLIYLQITFGLAWALFIAIGFYAILNRKIATHRAFMMRAYALAQGAGTQSVLLLMLYAIVGEPDKLTTAILIGTAWVINLSVAEWIIQRKRPAELGRIAAPVAAH